MSTPSSHLKTSHPVQLFSVTKPSPPPSSSSSALSSMKLKSLIHTLIVSHMCRIIRALSKVKTAIVEILKGNQSDAHFFFPYYNKKQKMSQKIIFGSFRLHYNWCSSKSSHVIPVPSRVFEGLPQASDTHLCYEVESDEQFCHHDDDSRLAGYLQWLEEKVHEDDDDNKINNIDMLAEMFIADCHEKFKLEKQESDRRFHEMLARGM